jgi:hypothetical protein
MYHSPVSLSAEINFSDLPLEEGIKWVEAFNWHSLLSFQGQCTYAGYEDVQSVAYILCEKDKCIAPAFQQKMIKVADEGRRGKGKGEVKVYTLDSGHCPIASRPKDTAELVARAVEEMK